MINHEQPEPDSNQSVAPIQNLGNNNQNPRFVFKKSFTLRTKATLIAIALGVVPVATVGLLSYLILKRSVTEQISTEQLEKTAIAADHVTRFLEARVREVEALSKNAVLTNSKFRDAATLREKRAILNNFKNELRFYNSVIFLDLKGKPLFKALSYHLDNTDYAKADYFQEAIKTKKITINGPGISEDLGQLRIEFAAPVKDSATGELIGILKVKIPGNYIRDLFDAYQEYNQHWYLINAEGTIFAGDRIEHLNQPLATHFSGVVRLHEAKESGVAIFDSKMNHGDSHQEEGANLIDRGDSHQQEDTHPIDRGEGQQEGNKQLVSYVATKAPEQFPDLHIGTLISIPEDLALASLEKLGWTIFLGTAAAAVLVGAIAAYLANRATLPILDAVSAVKKIGAGDLDIRLKVSTKDELGELNANINLMTQQIQSSLQEQQQFAEQQRQDKEQLEIAIYNLLEEVSDATEGDLTVRANLDSLELSTVADLFNAIIGSLQDIAVEAKQSTTQVSDSLKQNEAEIRLLAEQAIEGARETYDTLISATI